MIDRPRSVGQAWRIMISQEAELKRIRDCNARQYKMIQRSEKAVTELGEVVVQLTGELETVRTIAWDLVRKVQARG